MLGTTQGKDAARYLAARVLVAVEAVKVSGALKLPWGRVVHRGGHKACRVDGQLGGWGATVDRTGTATSKSSTSTQQTRTQSGSSD